MATSIHIPKPLLDAVDKRAKRLKMSRNGFIVRAVQRELAHETEWSPGFFEQLTAIDQRDGEAMDAVLASVLASRTRKPPPKL